MSTDPGPAQGGQGAGEHAQPSEEELRAAYEAELSRITSTDMIAQATVSLLNIAARRLGPPAARRQAADAEPGEAGAAPSESDLEQVRDAIDAARALLEILERRIPQEVRSLRDALSQLQMAYAGEVQAGGEVPAPGPGGQAPGGEPPVRPGEEQAREGEAPEAPGPAQASGRLWVPGS